MHNSGMNARVASEDDIWPETDEQGQMTAVMVNFKSLRGHTAAGGKRWHPDGFLVVEEAGFSTGADAPTAMADALKVCHA